MRRFIRFVRAMCRWALSGFKRSKEVGRRTRLCIRCPYNNGGVCDVCGCVLKYKVRLETEECPLGKW
jgi:hypothetical protein